MTTIRPNVQAMRPYEPGKPISTVQRELGLKRVVKLASNENPLGPSPKAIEAVQRALQELHLYPDGAAFELRNALAVRHGLPMSQIVVGNGSDELIANLAVAIIENPEDEIVTSECSFPCYDTAAELAPCRLVKVPLDSSWRIDLRGMAASISDRTKIVFIANPNNPTGTYVSREAMNDFLDRVSEEVLIVLDEAYFEFARSNHDYPDGREYLLQGRNVAVLRTFSKAYGLAGLRLGYGFVPEYLAKANDRVRSPFHVNTLAQVAGLAAIHDDAHVRRTLDNNKEGLAMLRLAFEEAGCGLTDTVANFHFVDLHRPAAPIADALLKRGFIVRTFGSAPNHLRVTVGNPEENLAFVEAFREVVPQ